MGLIFQNDSVCCRYCLSSATCITDDVRHVILFHPHKTVTVLCPCKESSKFRPRTFPIKGEDIQCDPKDVYFDEHANRLHVPVQSVTKSPLSKVSIINTPTKNDKRLFTENLSPEEGPVDYKPGEAIGAPDHPHRGFETVSYILAGELQHRDSAGNSGTLGPGCVQWMTAGSGVVHSEMPTTKMMENGGQSEGFQLWVNLPAKDKMIAPRYQDTSPDKIPVVETNDKQVKVKVIAGESMGKSAYIDTRTPIMYLDIHLDPGATFTQPVPESYNGFIYVYRGKGILGVNQLSAKMGQVAVMGSGTEVTITAGQSEGCNVLLIAGAPIGEPVAWHGPFVMNTQAQIKQAIDDYQAGRLGEIPGREGRMKLTEDARARQNKHSSS